MMGGGAGPQPDMKAPGTYKNREEVVNELMKTQPELVNAKKASVQFSVVGQFMAMGIIEDADYKKLQRVGKLSILSLITSCGSAALSWKFAHSLLQEVPRRGRVIGRTLISIGAFSVPFVFLSTQMSGVTRSLYEDYSERYIQFLLTNDVSKLNKDLAEKMRRGAPPLRRPGVRPGRTPRRQGRPQRRRARQPGARRPVLVPGRRGEPLRGSDRRLPVI